MTAFVPPSPEIVAAIQAHAIAAYPNEMVGAVTPSGYRPLVNHHPDPKEHFDCRDQADVLMAAGELLALVHSHPDGPEAPSGHDIASQRAMDVPWGIVLCTAEVASIPYWWGDMLEPPPLVGRQFRHGPSGTDGRGDCGALIRDFYRVELGIEIPDFPRDDDWWKEPGRDLYTQHFAAAGFRQILPVPPEKPEPELLRGDVVLIQWRVPPTNPVPNHGAIYMGDGTLLHHLSGRLSRPEPLLHWRKFIRSVLRHAAR